MAGSTRRMPTEACVEHQSKSKSSSWEGCERLDLSMILRKMQPTSSLYRMIVRLSLEVSTQVTKSSMCLSEV